MESESRTTKFLKNAISSAIYQIVNAVCGMITPYIMLNAYGSFVNGLVSSITQFLSFLAIVEAGLALAAQQSLYKPLVEKDNDRISSIVTAAKVAYNQVGGIFTLLTVALAFLYPIFSGTEEMSYLTIVILVFVLAMNYVLSFFVVSKYQVLFQADQKVYVISLAKTAARIINTLCIIFLASPNVPILLLRIVVSSSVLVQALIIKIYAKRNYKNINYNHPYSDKSALGQRWDALYLQIVGSVTASAPVIILTMVSSLEEVSVYSIYNMVFAALMSVLGIFINGINASFGTLLYSKERNRTEAVYSEFENAYYLIISIIYTVTLVMIVPFVRIYTEGITDTNYLLPGLGVIFTINAFLYNLKTPQGMMVQAAGLFRKTRTQNTIQALILLIFGLILGHFWGIYGVLFASILSNGYRCVDLFIFIPKQVTHSSPLLSFKRAGIMVMTSIALYLSVDYVLGKIDTGNAVSWIICAAIVFVFVAIIYLFVDFIFERENFCAIVFRLKDLLRRK